MSTALMPENPLQRSTWARLRCTPMRDLVRGRLSCRLDLAAIVHGAGLTPPVSDLVLKVVSKTRLWRLEKADVAKELAAHFQDGLESGAAPQELIEAFGDPGRAAKLIRRAKKRNRPWAWRASRNAIRVVVAFVGVVLFLYALQTARFYLSSPSIKEDFRPRINAAALSTREADRAWPLYRQALMGMPALPNIGNAKEWANHSREPEPGEPGWEVMAAYLAGQQERLALARQAAAKPAFGRPVDFDMSPEDRVLWPSEQVIGGGDFREHSLFEILLPHLNSLRRLSMALSADAHRAAAAGDGATAVVDIEAVLGIARHVREQPFMISDLVAVACASRAVDDVSFVLDRYPSSLRDEDLTRLAHRLGAMTDDDMRIRFDSEEWGFADFLQRAYTDDGEGDGRLTPAGVKMIHELTSIAGTVHEQDPWVSLLAPGGSLAMLGRHDMMMEYARLIDMFRSEAATPLWLRKHSEPGQIIEGWASSPVQRIRHLPLVLLFPAVGHASIHAQLAMERRDGAILAVAIELFHRRHGVWPASQDDLVPSMLPGPLVDRFDGGRLRFLIRNDRPVVYSVGVDGDDDGGRWPAYSDGRPDTSEVSRWRPRNGAIMRTKTTDMSPDAPSDPEDGDWILWPPLHQPLIVRTDP